MESSALDPGSSFVSPALESRPEAGQDLLEPGTYEISIEIRGRNADAQRYVVPVSWDGERSDRAATCDHLLVEPPRRLP